MKKNTIIIIIGLGLLTLFVYPTNVTCPNGPCLTGPNPEGKACYDVAKKPLISKWLNLNINYSTSTDCR